MVATGMFVVVCVLYTFMHFSLSKLFPARHIIHYNHNKFLMERTSPYPATLTVGVIDICFFFLCLHMSTAILQSKSVLHSLLEVCKDGSIPAPGVFCRAVCLTHIIGQKLACSHYKQSGTCCLRYGQLEECSF